MRRMSVCWCNISKDFSASLPASRSSPPSRSPFPRQTSVPALRRPFLPLEPSVGAVLLYKGEPDTIESPPLEPSPHRHAPSHEHPSAASTARLSSLHALHWFILRPCANDRIRHLHLTPTSSAPSQLPKIHYPGRICACTSLQEIHLSAIRLTS